MPDAAIWWVRRDLRLGENPVLQESLQRGAWLIPAFIIDDRLVHSPYSGAHRLAFLLEGLRHLDINLRSRGSYLVIRRGDPIEQLSRLLVETGANAILAEPDVSPFASQRDRLADSLLPMHWIGSPAIHFPGSVLKPDGKPYTTFTPFARTWKALPTPDVGTYTLPPRILTPEGLFSLPIPATPPLSPDVPFLPDEAAALERLRAFTDGSDDGISSYAEMRNRLDLPGTSGLSPYLRFGMLSPRRAYSAAARVLSAAPDASSRQGAETWLDELIWRDFYIHLLYHFPRVRQGDYRSMRLHWENNPEHFRRWCEGETGYPVVDAAMRSLTVTGWMHNRARMIVASFLTKHLLIDWRWGEQWFMQHLVDGDPASNNGGWQWCAGTGSDAAPYFRIFNPVTQGQTHDPDGYFVRRWVPALRDVPTEFVHAPWTMPDAVQRAAGCRIGRDYPSPVVDHAAARQRALDAYGHKQPV